MVQKNKNFVNAIDITIAEFGFGDILIGTGSANKIGYCSFTNQEAHPLSVGLIKKR